MLTAGPEGQGLDVLHVTHASSPPQLTHIFMLTSLVAFASEHSSPA